MTQESQSHLSSVSRVCFILLFPASDNVAHIMGSCTTLWRDRKLIQIVCIEGNDLITWQFICCSNLPDSDSQIDPPTVLVHFIGCPQKFNSLRQISELCEVFFPSQPAMKLNYPVGLCYNPCSCSRPNCMVINAALESGPKVVKQFSS